MAFEGLPRFSARSARGVGTKLNLTNVSSGNRPSRLFASVSDREEFPERASAMAPPYSTSRPFESSSAAVALLLASRGFPKKGFARCCCGFELSRPLPPAGLLSQIRSTPGHPPYLPQVARICQDRSLFVGEPVFGSESSLTWSRRPFHSCLVAPQKGDLALRDQKLRDFQFALEGSLTGVFGLFQATKENVVSGKIRVPEHKVRIELNTFLGCCSRPLQLLPAPLGQTLPCPARAPVKPINCGTASVSWRGFLSLRSTIDR
jgi:hypothetical protein